MRSRLQRLRIGKSREKLASIADNALDTLAKA